MGLIGNIMKKLEDLLLTYYDSHGSIPLDIAKTKENIGIDEFNRYCSLSQTDDIQNESAVWDQSLEDNIEYIESRNLLNLNWQQPHQVIEHNIRGTPITATYDPEDDYLTLQFHKTGLKYTKTEIEAMKRFQNLTKSKLFQWENGMQRPIEHISKTEHTIVIDLGKRQIAEADNILDLVKNVFDGLNPNQAMHDKLAELFPDKDYDTIGKIIDEFDPTRPELINIVTDTATGLIVSMRPEQPYDFESKGKKVWLKISKNVDKLKKEQQFAEHMWENPLLRAITPRTIDIIEHNNTAGLFTYDAKESPVSEADLILYKELRTETINKYAEKFDLNPFDLVSDKHMIDVYNRALIHTHMRKHMKHPAYSRGCSSSVFEKQIIENMIADSKIATIEDIELITIHMPLYQRKIEQATLYDLTARILGHYDYRLENIFSDDNLRKIGDFGSTKPGTEEFDLGKLEVESPKKYVHAYSHFRNYLEQQNKQNFEYSEKDIETLTEKTHNLCFINSIRAMAYKLQQGAKNYTFYKKLIPHYAKLAE